MATFVFNKLIRDKLKSEYERLGQVASYKKLTKEEFAEALKRKLIEEANEIDPADKESVLNELADIYQVVEDLIKLYDLNPQDIGDIKNATFEKKGGFAGANFVETLTLDDNDEWNDYYRQSPEVFPEVGKTSKRASHEQLTVPELTPGKYQHYRGDFYEVIGAGLDTETLEPMVIYKPLYDSPVSHWIRPYAIFTEEIEVDNKKVKRFQKVDD
jgi:predicted house-cleaning noncanonical NTP pyrophosphatase (MazG superfamily)